MNKFLITLPVLCSLPALFSCVSQQPKQEIWGVKPIFNVQHAAGSARDYYQLGRYFQGQNRLEQAADAYNKALAMDSSHIEAHNALGAIYSTQGKFEQAIVEFNNVIERAPQAAHLFNNLGYTYFLQQKYPEAIETFEKALALDPKHERSLNNLAQAYTQNGNSAKATEILARVDALKGVMPTGPLLAKAPAQPPTLVVAPTPMQNLEKISTTERTSLLAVAPTIAKEQSVNNAATTKTIAAALTPALPVSPVPIDTVKAAVAATPVTAQNLDKISVSELSPSLNAAPDVLKQTTAVTAVKNETSTPNAPTPPSMSDAQPVAETTTRVTADVTPAASGYSVAAGLQTELKSLPVERNFASLAALVTPVVARPAKTNSITAVAMAVAEAKPAQAENITAFEKITEAALKELTPNVVKLKAATDLLVAGIFRGIETAFSELAKAKPFRLEIANGNGVSGLAKKVSDLLASNGVSTAHLTNNKTYQLPQTVIQYRNGYQMQAASLSKGMRNKPQVVEIANLRGTTDVRLVLGRDVKTQTALFDTEPAKMMLASSAQNSDNEQTTK